MVEFYPTLWKIDYAVRIFEIQYTQICKTASKSGSDGRAMRPRKIFSEAARQSSTIVYSFRAKASSAGNVSRFCQVSVRAADAFDPEASHPDKGACGNS
jgi:hypothetical protein